MENQNNTGAQAEPSIPASPIPAVSTTGSQITTEKKRGIFLTIMLLWTAFGLLQLLYQTINPETLPKVPGIANPSDLGLWYQILTVVGLVIGFTTVIGIWMWKKWGVYLYGVSFTLNLITSALIQRRFMSETVRAQYGLLIYILPIIFGALFLWAISRKWKNFE